MDCDPARLNEKSDVINTGLTRCSALCLIAPIAERGLNPVYCFSNCHGVYSRGFRRTLLLIPPPCLLLSDTHANKRGPALALMSKKPGSPPPHLLHLQPLVTREIRRRERFNRGVRGYNKSSMMFMTCKSSPAGRV